MIKEININIPSSTNKNIINNLYYSKNWYFGWDENSSQNVNKKDSGLILDTLTFNNDILNTYANVIFNIVEKDL
jgi:hypothetical protein